MLSAGDALKRLKEGNARFVANEAQGSNGVSDPMRRLQLVGGQEPFAIILGCSDSRAPAELVFDQGLGDLFVIRVAGNVIAPPDVMRNADETCSGYRNTRGTPLRTAAPLGCARPKRLTRFGLHAARPRPT